MGPFRPFNRLLNAANRPILARQSVIMAKRPSSDMAAFQEKLKAANHVAIITGAGISAESGIPTFRGAGGLWRTYAAQDLASPSAFKRDPSLVWEFYHYRRELVLTKTPNKAHEAVAKLEANFKKAGKNVAVITQNIDELHRDAGTVNLIELHGSLFKVRCTRCAKVWPDRSSPICESLHGLGAPEPGTKGAQIRPDRLPQCPTCQSLARPHVVWFGESLDPSVLDEAGRHLQECDLCLVIGTSSVVYPAAMFAPQVAARGVPVAEFNLEDTPMTDQFGFRFSGSASETVPKALEPCL